MDTNTVLGFAFLLVGISDFVLVAMLGPRLPPAVRMLVRALGIVFVFAGLAILMGYARILG